MIKEMKRPTKIICAGAAGSVLFERWEQVLSEIPVPYEFQVILTATHCFDEEGTEDELFASTLAYLNNFKNS